MRLARFFARPQNGLGEPVDTMAGESIVWARHLIWGNYRVTGGVPLPGSNAWAATVVWGDSRTAGRPARGVGRRQSRQRRVG